MTTHGWWGLWQEASAREISFGGRVPEPRFRIETAQRVRLSDALREIHGESWDRAVRTGRPLEPKETACA